MPGATTISAPARRRRKLMPPSCRARDRRHAKIDVVAEEQPGEGLRQDDRDAELWQRLRRLLARGAETEIVAADHDVARPHGGCEAWIDRLEAVAGHLLDRLFHVEGGGPGVGVGVVTEHESPAPRYRLAPCEGLSLPRSAG